MHTVWPVHPIPRDAETPGRGVSHEARAMLLLRERGPSTADEGEEEETLGSSSGG